MLRLEQAARPDTANRTKSAPYRAGDSTKKARASQEDKQVAQRKQHTDETGGRTTRLLAGLIVALSLLFVALQYRSGENDLADMTDDTADIENDVELMPQQRRDDMIAAVLPQKEQKSITADIKKVDKPTGQEVPEKLEQAAGGDDTGKAAETEQNSADDEAQTAQPVATDMHDNPLNFRIVEQLPEFPGGMVELMKWITRNLRYPPSAQRQKIQGKVVVAFIIGKDGSVSEIKVTQKADPTLDREAMRVIRMMPKWKPGEMNGKPCATYFCIPVNFKL